MEEIFSLMQCLSSREWESFQNYLTCFSTHGEDPCGPKQLQLARILKETKECPGDTRCCLRIYGVKKNTGFEALKSRLKEKALDFLLTDISADKKYELDEADYAIIKMKKKSAQFQQLYYSKKRIPMMYGLLDDIINLAKEYEHHFILMEHLKAKKNLVAFKIGKEEFDKINNEMQIASHCSNLYNKAEHYYFEIIMMNEYNSKHNNNKKMSFLQKAIVEIAEENKEIKSAHVNYSLKFLELEFYQLKNDHTKARSICTELIGIVRDNKSVYRRQRMGVVFDNLSRCDYYVGLLKHAVNHAREAQQYFNPDSENFCIALEQEFYALFALKKYDNAVEIANKMLASATPKELGAFRHAKYNYLLANALFKQGRFNEVLHILSQSLEISKDKAGWEIGLRVLKIMTLVETLKLNEASLAVLSLKRILAFTNKKTPVSQRDKTIYSLLHQAERVGFMFTMLNGNTENNMKALTGGGEQKWEPFTHEVIPFHEWFKGKMGKKVKPKVLSPKSIH